MIGVFPGRQDIAQFVKTEDGYPRIIVDEAVETLCLRKLGRQIKQREEDGLRALQDRVVAEG
jgi:hypothetical protein